MKLQILSWDGILPIETNGCRLVGDSHAGLVDSAPDRGFAIHLSRRIKPQSVESMSETYQCPFCDSTVKVGEPCPGCAPKLARKRQAPPPRSQAWQQDEIHDALDLPDEDFDYDEFVAREFGRVPHRRLGVKWYWWVLGVVLLLLIAALIAMNRW